MSRHTIKIDLEKALKGRTVINLGCGPNKPTGQIGVDHLDLPGVDIVADLNDGLPFLPDHSVDEVHSESVFEHIDVFEHLVAEVVRVLKPGGRCHVFVPHFSNPYFYSDYTHSKHMGLYTFYYFVDPEFQLRRKVPTFYTATRIRISSIRLEFSSSFAGLRLIKRCVQRVVNSSPRMQELYEENLCYLLPCYGIRVVFHPA